MALNERQRAAVYTKGKDLMVSASAGAGKTYSLCMRVLEELKSGKSIDRMLIVTFTKSAAADLKKKLAKELQKAIGEAKDKETRDLLKSQKALLPCAPISTIDSFCYDLVKENFASLGVSPGIRIADDAEMNELKKKLMRKAVDRLYKSEKKELLTELFSDLSGSYNDPELIVKLIGACARTENLIEGVDMLKNAARLMREEAELPFEKGWHGAIITEKCKKTAKSVKRVFETLIERGAGDPFFVKNAKPLSAYIGRAEEILRIADDPEKLAQLIEIGYKNPSVNGLTNTTEPNARAFGFLRDLYAKDFLAKLKDCGIDTFENYRESYRKYAELTECLYELFSEYRNLLFERKKKSGAYEFSDIERMTYDLLYENGRKSALAEKLSLEFDELYIDEYQDVNEIQDRIFLALARGNRYVVGDIKQSIYGFRGACPQIFNGLRESYPDNDAPGCDKGKIFFQENFRSTREILSFVNAAIGPLMRSGTDMVYLPEDDLQPNEELSRHGPKPVLCLVSADDPRWSENGCAELNYTVASIKKMIDSGIKGSDIAVLTRGNGSVQAVREALAQAGIATASNSRDGFFEKPEIVLLRSLMELLDNPTKDVCLAGAMRSPVFGFTLDELAQIRLAKRKGSLFSALCDYAENGEDADLKARCRRVLDFIGSYRRKAQESAADTLIFRMMDELMILPLLTAGKRPEEASVIRENVLAFYDIVRGLCSAGSKDLGKLIRQFTALAENGKLESKSPPEVPEDHVRVMTIHASKGLEFEVCWLYGAGKDLMNSGNRLNFGENSGAIFGLRDREIPWIKEKTPVEAAYKILYREQLLNEELRLLYVALTRAKTRLFISAQVGGRGIGESRLKDMRCCPKELLEGGVWITERTTAYIKWLMLALDGGSDLYKELHGDLPQFEEALKESSETSGESTTQTALPLDPALVAAFEKRLGFEYPYEPLVRLPVKKAVSALSPSALDDEEEEERPETPAAAGTRLLPRFYAESKGIASVGDAARKGTATHAFMQFCRFDLLEKNGFESEKQRLIDEHFLSPDVAALVEKRAVEGFLESMLFSRLRKAKRIYREQRFMIALPASDFTVSPEKKERLKDEQLLVQGVIDCFFEDENGRQILFDYKTDHFSREELRDRDACARALIERHKTQLSYYREAICRMTGRKVDATYIYSFALNREIEVSF